MRIQPASRIAWSVAFALAIIASAVLFRSNPAAPWIETALTGIALTLFVLTPSTR